jgi:hypothetical protein
VVEGEGVGLEDAGVFFQGDLGGGLGMISNVRLARNCLLWSI